MSRAEELARQVIHEWEDYSLGGARVNEVVAELRRLSKIEEAAQNLIKVKGRYHTEQAFKALAALLVNTGGEAHAPEQD